MQNTPPYIVFLKNLESLVLMGAKIALMQKTSPAIYKKFQRKNTFWLYLVIKEDYLQTFLSALRSSLT